MRPFLAQFSEPVWSGHLPSWADFITTTPVFRFSVHTIEAWRAAIDGDAAAAVKVARRLRMPETINVRLDLAMTVLTAAAFDDASAAAVLADLVESAPLDPTDRTGISTSWRVHKIWCESRVLNRRRRRLQGLAGGDA